MGIQRKLNHIHRLIQLVPPEESDLTPQEAIKLVLSSGKTTEQIATMRDTMERHFAVAAE